MFGAIIGGLAGAIAGGVGSYLTSVQHANAYKQAANDIKNAANKYSGENANASIYNAGLNQASRENAAQMSNAAATQSGSNNAMGEMNARMNNINAGTEGYNTGAQNQSTLNAAKFNKDTQYAQNAMKQADIQNAVNGQMLQGAATGAQNLIDTYKDISDENMKEGINNDSGLPKADIQDVLRQLETIVYKYKDPSYPGCDDEEHCGFTAQSLEKAGNPNDTVSENEDGIKQVDRWRLMETVTAGLAELQREIDSLKGNTSDERCKEAENAIESNPEQAAKQLPQGSPIQQEAEQITDNNPNNDEVNNKAVDDWYTAQTKKWPNLRNSQLESFWMRDFGNKGIHSKESYDAWNKIGMDAPANGEFDEYPKIKASGLDYDSYMGHKQNMDDYETQVLQSKTPEELEEYLRDDPDRWADSIIELGDASQGSGGPSPIHRMLFNKIIDYAVKNLGFEPKYDGSNIINISSPMWYDFVDKYLARNNTKEEVDPITAKMNEGLSEDDPDYFTSDERMKSIGKKFLKKE